MPLTLRPYQNESDYERMRAFLRALFLRHGRRERCWQVYRLDYWRRHGIANLGSAALEKTVFLWETPDGALQAFLNSEAAGLAFLQVAPEARSPALLTDMVATAEARLTAPDAAGRRRLRVVRHEHDDVLKSILVDRGFRRLPGGENYHARPLTGPPPERSLPPGYTIRPLGDEAELPARSWLSWRAFHPDEPDEKYEGWAWYRHIQRAPLYRRDLDLVAVAPDGELAAFCTIWFDDVTLTGAFEPVGTHPEHQRRGLGAALLADSLRRLRERGATLATVGSGAPGPRAFYESLGLAVRDRGEYWEQVVG